MIKESSTPLIVFWGLMKRVYVFRGPKQGSGFFDCCLQKHTDLVKVSPDYVNVSSQSLQVVIALLGAEVASAENVLDLPRDQQLLELGWQGVAPVGDVQVT